MKALLCRIGPDAVQQAAILSLGHCKQEFVGMLLEEMQSLGDDSIDRAKAGLLLGFICFC